MALLCPTNGDQVGGRFRIVVQAPAGADLIATTWISRGTSGSVQRVASSKAGSSGVAVLALPLTRMMRGPVAVKVVAAGVKDPLYVQFVNVGGVRQRAAPSAAAAGMDLKFDEDFAGALSTSRSGAGAIYASGKPNSYGVDDFGEAIFAQPGGTNPAMGTIPGGYLRIRARALGKSEKDPAGYGRTSTSGLISSGHMGGSGFSAQYGYFETRMLAPAGTGTWPAFWMLSTGSLASGGSTGEIDAAELYGDDPTAVYQTSHSWQDHRDVLGRSVFSRLPADGDSALSWHRYGARVTRSGVTYTVDGKVVGATAATVAQSEPFFFLANLALKPGWKAGLAGTGGRADLYIDYIRVWV